MIACLDVAYTAERAIAACVMFEDWSDGIAVLEFVREYGAPAPCRRGSFFE